MRVFLSHTGFKLEIAEFSIFIYTPFKMRKQLNHHAAAESFLYFLSHECLGEGGL